MIKESNKITMPTFVVRGQVLKVCECGKQVHLYLSGLLDDDRDAWLPMFPQAPQWVLDGAVFKAELDASVETFESLAANPLAIDFCYAPRPSLRPEALRKALGIDE